MRIAVLASGSRGNASAYESRGTRVLVDAGLGPRALARRMQEAGMDGPLQAIVVTHAHQDHVGHAERLAKRLRIPVYMSEATARAVPLRAEVEVRRFSPREPFTIGALTLAPLPLPHDAAQVALVLSDGVRNAGIATDLGEVPPALAEHLSRCDVLLLESNHDPALLAAGPYPDHLKRRIASARGHLSNGQAAELLARLPARAHSVVLMHLSERNNRPDLALTAAREALVRRDVRLEAASQTATLVLDAAPPEGPGTPAQLALPL